jgi:hypothetical protein
MHGHNPADNQQLIPQQEKAIGIFIMNHQYKIRRPMKEF